jgi:hypothetical protein
MNDTIKEAFDEKWGKYLSLYPDDLHDTFLTFFCTGWTAGRMQMSEKRCAELTAQIAEMAGETDVHTP